MVELPECIGKVENLVAVSMGIARLLRMPEVRKEYLGTSDLSLLLMGEALESAAHDAEEAIEWENESPSNVGQRPRTP